MMKRTISAMVGKGSVNHNSRKFKAENVDAERSHLNVDYCNENIKKVYHKLFDEALQRYNEKQTRADRRIDDYYEKIRNSKQEKTFHELILQIGDKGNMNADSEKGQLAKRILDEYYREFQARNPNLYVFSAHLHMDVKYSIVLIVYGVYRVREKLKIGTTYTNRKKNVYDVTWKRIRKILKSGIGSGSFFMP